MSLHTSVRGILLTAFIGAVSPVHSAENPGPPSDTEITLQVERLIAAHPELGTLFTVQTKKGVVYLGGSAFTPFSQANAENVVRQVPGVRAVVDLSWANDE